MGLPVLSSVKPFFLASSGVSSAFISSNFCGSTAEGHSDMIKGGSTLGVKINFLKLKVQLFYPLKGSLRKHGSVETYAITLTTFYGTNSMDTTTNNTLPKTGAA